MEAEEDEEGNGAHGSFSCQKQLKTVARLPVNLFPLAKMASRPGFLAVGQPSPKSTFEYGERSEPRDASIEGVAQLL
ncbi:hypothetical protein QLX08_003411 [Tetragonisca angustula]|uniref:Uncharacterized protein n=1 Tax=Tetragonisca angustula TaxID=166442 RepID=A0AAW1A6R8_9HYME